MYIFWIASTRSPSEPIKKNITLKRSVFLVFIWLESKGRHCVAHTVNGWWYFRKTSCLLVASSQSRWFFSCYLSVGVSSVSRDIIFRVQQKPISLGHEVSAALAIPAAWNSTFILALNFILYYWCFVLAELQLLLPTLLWCFGKIPPAQCLVAKVGYLTHVLGGPPHPQVLDRM